VGWGADVGADDAVFAAEVFGVDVVVVVLDTPTAFDCVSVTADTDNGVGVTYRIIFTTRRVGRGTGVCVDSAAIVGVIDVSTSGWNGDGIPRATIVFICAPPPTMSTNKTALENAIVIYVFSVFIGM
jgi:hypothetical protein